jgi:hypothetical protein
MTTEGVLERLRRLTEIISKVPGMQLVGYAERTAAFSVETVPLPHIMLSTRFVLAASTPGN